MSQEIPIFNGEVLFVAVSEVSLIEQRRTGWTPEKLSVLMSELFPVFVENKPVAVLARIGLHPSSESSEKALSRTLLYLHFQVIHSLEDLDKHPAFVYDKQVEPLREKLGLDPETKFVFHTIYMPENRQQQRGQGFRKRGFVQVYPVVNLDKTE